MTFKTTFLIRTKGTSRGRIAIVRHSEDTFSEAVAQPFPWVGAHYGDIRNLSLRPDGDRFGGYFLPSRSNSGRSFAGEEAVGRFLKRYVEIPTHLVALLRKELLWLERNAESLNFGARWDTLRFLEAFILDAVDKGGK